MGRCGVVCSTLAFGSTGRGFDLKNRYFSHHSKGATTKGSEGGGGSGPPTFHMAFCQGGSDTPTVGGGIAGTPESLRD